MTFARYVAIQLVAYLIDMGGFLLLTQSDLVQPLAANVVAKLVAGCFAFVAHRLFTFSAATEGNAFGQGARYFALLAANIPLASFVFWGLLFVVQPAAIAKFLADVIGVLLTYWLSKRFVFGRAGMGLRRPTSDER